MAIRVIVTGQENPILRTKAQKVRTFGKELQKLVSDLLMTVDHVKGAGLAAPQIGEGEAVCVAKIAGAFTPLINPNILWATEEKVLGEEGCLSLPDIWLYVPRSTEIVLRYQNEKGKEEERRLQGFDARVVQHEVDHLNGILIVDYHGKGAAVVPGEAL
jgi:peptide deformylase